MQRAPHSDQELLRAAPVLREFSKVHAQHKCYAGKFASVHPDVEPGVCLNGSKLDIRSYGQLKRRSRRAKRPLNLPIGEFNRALERRRPSDLIRSAAEDLRECKADLQIRFSEHGLKLAADRQYIAPGASVRLLER